MVICKQLQKAFQFMLGRDQCTLISLVLHEKEKKSNRGMQMITNCIVRMIREQSNALFYSLVLHIQY